MWPGRWHTCTLVMRSECSATQSWCSIKIPFRYKLVKHLVFQAFYWMQHKDSSALCFISTILLPKPKITLKKESPKTNTTCTNGWRWNVWFYLIRCAYKRAFCCSPSRHRPGYPAANRKYECDSDSKCVLHNLYHLPSPPLGASAADLVINSTATGIQLQCHMKYYTSEMNITWYHG